MKLSNKNYDYLKWIVTILLPALGTLVGSLGSAFAWEHTQVTLVVLTAVTTFLGGLIGVSTHNYNKEEE